MRRVTYEQKECGDILLVANPAIEISKLIIAAEREIVPGLDFYPSHVAIYDGADWVEAWLDLKENSVAAVNPGSKYDDSAYQREVWRPEGSPNQKSLALAQYVAEYARDPYGTLDLLGFLLEAGLRKIGWHDAPNPIQLSFVCSEGGLLYLRKLNDIIPCVAHGPLFWTLMDEAVRNVSPADLRRLFLRHEVKAEVA